MRCYECNNRNMKVFDTASRDSVIHRIRKCPVCGAEYATRETIWSFDEEDIKKTKYTINKTKKFNMKRHGKEN